MLTPQFQKQLEEINKMSIKINTDSDMLRMMEEHIQEIKERFSNNDEHWSIETFDLIMLSLQLLKRKGYDIDEIKEKALPRFYKKLGS